jgi:ABC-type Fe3+-citrate transport system substrate-binding protein
MSIAPDNSLKNQDRTRAKCTRGLQYISPALQIGNQNADFNQNIQAGTIQKNKSP